MQLTSSPGLALSLLLLERSRVARQSSFGPGLALSLLLLEPEWSARVIRKCPGLALSLLLLEQFQLGIQGHCVRVWLCRFFC